MNHITSFPFLNRDEQYYLFSELGHKSKAGTFNWILVLYGFVAPGANTL